MMGIGCGGVERSFAAIRVPQARGSAGWRWNRARFEVREPVREEIRPLESLGERRQGVRRGLDGPVRAAVVDVEVDHRPYLRIPPEALEEVADPGRLVPAVVAGSHLPDHQRLRGADLLDEAAIGLV